MTILPTPITDKAKIAFTSLFANDDAYWIPYVVAVKLEHELTAAQEELAEWSILKGWGGTPEIINDFIKGQQTRIHYAQNIEEELTAVTEQRDRLAEAFRKIKKAGGTHDDSYDELDFIADVIFEALQSLNQPTEP